MKTIARIARLELSALFYSPVAWLTLIIFIIQSGLDFASTLQLFERYQEVGEKMDNLTRDVYSSSIFGLFSLVQGNLYLYIPLMTMGLVSREIHSGSIKLLLSSPVTISEIVLGKYLAMMVYGLAFLSVLILCSAAGTFFIRSADTGLLFSGLLGLYLLICAYSAIGLFMSCLTSYQVVAAISTFVVFAALNYIGNLGQTVAFVRDITWFLSISGRAAQFITGLITSKDVLYFIIVIALFLGLAILKLKANREALSPVRKTIRYTVLVVSMLLLGYLTSRPALTGYADLTATQSRTLTPNSQKIVKQMNGRLKVHSYVNMLDANNYYGLPGSGNRDQVFFEQYLRFLPGLSFDYTYYYDSSKNDKLYRNNPGLSLKELAKRSAHSAEFDFNKLLNPAEMKKIIDLAPEEHRFVRQFEYESKEKKMTYSYLRIFDDVTHVPSESEISAALKRLIVTPPKIAFLTGNGERSMDRIGDKDYRIIARQLTFRYSLVNQGFDVLNLSLPDSSIPKDITAVVLADPRMSFSPEELQKLNHYLDAGGNMLIAGEPGNQALLNPLLQGLGVQLGTDTIMQPGKDFAPDFVRATLASPKQENGPNYEDLRKEHAEIGMPGVTTLSYSTNSPFAINPLLVKDQHTVLALTLTRPAGSRQQKIIVLGDADFMNNVESGRRNAKTANFSFITGLFKWLSDDEFPIDTKRQDTPDNRFRITREDIGLVRIVLLGIIPGILLIAGSILLIRRVRK